MEHTKTRMRKSKTTNKRCMYKLLQYFKGLVSGDGCDWCWSDAGLLQMQEAINCSHDQFPDNMALYPNAFASKSLSCREWEYSNIEREALGILHEPKKFHHYCFGKEVHATTDHRPLVAMISKDVMMLSQHLQCIMLHLHHYSVNILYKPGPELYITEWL